MKPSLSFTYLRLILADKVADGLGHKGWKHVLGRGHAVEMERNKSLAILDFVLKPNKNRSG